MIKKLLKYLIILTCLMGLWLLIEHFCTTQASAAYLHAITTYLCFIAVALAINSMFNSKPRNNDPK